MNPEKTLEQITRSCQWLLGKSKGNNKLTPTCGVLDVDWEKKYFSPVYCALAYHLAGGGQSLFFMPPINTEIYYQASLALDISIEEVVELMQCCLYNNSVRSVFSVEVEIEQDKWGISRTNIVKKIQKEIQISSNQDIINLASQLNNLYPSVFKTNYPADNRSFVLELKPVPSEPSYNFLYPQRFKLGNDK